MKQHWRIVPAVLVGLTVAVIAVVLVESQDVLTLGRVKAHAASLKSTARQHKLSTGLVFMLVFVVVNVFLPAAALLTLLGGYVFGVVRAALYVDVATTATAVLCFTASRNLCGKWVQKRYADQLESLNTHIAEYGHWYLLVVRLLPMAPFLWINLTAGVTKVKLRTFTWTTAVGSIPGIIIFSYAGKSLLSINAVEDVFTPHVVIAIALLVVSLGCVLMVRLLTKKG